MTPDNADQLIIPLQNRHHEYLADESRSSGNAESISFPRSEAQVREIVKTLSGRHIPITVQGSRTGITGGAVPAGGHIMNLSEMTRVTGMVQDQDGRFSIRVEPGITLSELDHQLEHRRLDTTGWDPKALKACSAFTKAERQFWPPDPSESSASVGGIAASNSRGICALHYGPAGDHINGIRVVDGKGHCHSIMRGQYVVSEGLCPLPGGGTLALDPGDIAPDCTADLIDLYLGSQGMLGVITELTLGLKPLPEELWGIVFFFDQQSGAVTFIQSVKKRPKARSDADIVAVELMDRTTLESVRDFKRVSTRLKDLPDWPHTVAAAVYVEIHGRGAGEIDPLCEWLLAKAAESGSDPDATWAACGKTETERLRLLRHAAPEAVNRQIDTTRQTDARITKLGTDMRLAHIPLSELIELYQTDLAAAGLIAAIFGHAADGHLHVNILPRDYREFERGQRLIENWARRIDAMGGNVVTEHGAGKIRKGLFRSIPLPGRLKLVRCLKRQLDPQEFWNPGTMPNIMKTTESEHDHKVSDGGGCRHPERQGDHHRS